MTESDLYELLEEARSSCGRSARALSEFLAARLPDTETDARAFAAERIFNFTGLRVILPPQADAAKGPLEMVAKQSGQVDEMLTSELPPGVDLCAVCGLPLAIGQQGCIVRVVPHDPVLAYHPFTPYFDWGLGVEVTSLAQRWSLMKKQEDGEGVIVRERLEYRDHPSKGDLAARRDRVEERKKQQRLGNER